MLRVFVRSLMVVALLVGAQTWLVAQTAAPKKTASTKADTAASTSIVNINTASADQLDSLPGIGPKVAARIIEYRQKNGPFKKIEDLMNVRGIGEKNFLKIRSRLAVGTPKPAVPNGQ